VTFRSTKVEGSKEHFTVTGDLTIRGVTRPITLDATFVERRARDGAGFWCRTRSKIVIEAQVELAE
jgi:polyisoprenoid-binding protein YceI